MISTGAYTGKQARARAPGWSAFHWRTTAKSRSAISSSHLANVRSISHPFKASPPAAIYLSRHGQAAIHADHLSGDIAGVIRGQKGDHGGNLRRLPQTLERDGAGYRAQNLASELFTLDLFQQGRIHQAWANYVYADTVAGVLACQSLGEGHHGGFGAGIDRLAQGADARRIGADIHNGAVTARFQVGQRRVAGIEDAAVVGGDNPIPQLRRAFEEGHKAVPAGVVDQNVQAAEAVHRRLSRSLHIFHAGDVGGVSFHPPAGFLVQAAGGGLSIILAEVGDEHLGASQGQGAADGGADAACTAGHDRDFAVQGHMHYFAGEGARATNRIYALPPALLEAAPAPQNSAAGCSSLNSLAAFSYSSLRLVSALRPSCSICCKLSCQGKPLVPHRQRSCPRRLLMNCRMGGERYLGIQASTPSHTLSHL